MSRGWTAVMNRVVKESLTERVMMGKGKNGCPSGGKASRQGEWLVKGSRQLVCFRCCKAASVAAGE